MRPLLAAAVLCLFAPAAHAVGFNLFGACSTGCSNLGLNDFTESILHLEIDNTNWSPGKSFGVEVADLSFFAAPLFFFDSFSHTKIKASRGHWSAEEGKIADIDFLFSASNSPSTLALTAIGSGTKDAFNWSVSLFGFVNPATGDFGASSPATFAFAPPGELFGAPAPIPLPAALPMLLAGLAGFAGLRWRRLRVGPRAGSAAI